MGKKVYLSDFEHGVVVGTRHTLPHTSETTGLLGFSGARVYREQSEKMKHQVSTNSLADKRSEECEIVASLQKLIEGQY